MKLSKHIFSIYYSSDKIKQDVVAEFLKSNPQIDTKEAKLDVVNLMVKDLDKHRKYLISKTIYNSLDKLKVKAPDWKLFNFLSECNNVYLLNENVFVIVQKMGSKLRILHFERIPIDKEQMYLRFRVIWVDTENGDRSSFDLAEKDELLLFQLMCFIHLTENEEIKVAPKVKYGVKKDPDMLLNDTPYPVTIINSLWHKTIIRDEGFLVRGHYALRKCGVGRANTRIVFIDPYEKKGYKRTYS